MSLQPRHPVWPFATSDSWLRRHLHVILLVLLAALAYAPLCSRYVRVADDITQSTALDQGFWHYWPTQFHRQGAWRIVGILLYGLGANHPLAYGPIAIAAHATVCCLFYFVAQRLLGGRGVPFLLVLVFACFPFGAQAVYSAAADALIVMQALFMLNLLLFLRFGDSPNHQFACLTGSFLIALLANAVQENLLVTFMACGLILWLDRPADTVARTIRQRYCVLGPMAAGVIFTLLFKFTQPPHPNKSMGFRPQPLLSAYYYQYANYYVLEPWTSSVLRPLIFWRWTAAAITLAAIAGSAALIIGYTWARSLTRPADEPLAAPPARPRPIILIYLLILSLANNAVHVVAGGYSVDSRKRYAMLPVFLLLAGWLARYLQSRFNLCIRRLTIAFACVLTITGIPSTWLNINIWRYESHRYRQLLDAMSQANATGPIEIRWNPDIYTEWPHAGVTWGDPLDAPITLDGPMQLRGLPSLTELDARPGPATIFQYDPSRDVWRVGP